MNPRERFLRRLIRATRADSVLATWRGLPVVLGLASVVLAAWGVWAFGAISGMGPLGPVGILIIVCGILLSLVWLTGLARQFVSAGIGGKLAWLIVPGVAAVVVVLAVCDVPRRARFAYARVELENAARAVLADPGAAGRYRNRSIGAEWISDVDTEAGAVVRFYLKGDWLNFTVLIYSPNGKPAEPQRRQTGYMVPMGRNWYRYELHS